MNYTPINTQRVQLPDGTLVKIEGGDANSTAALVANYIGLPGSSTRPNGIVRNIPPQEHHQPVLIPPVMNFRNPEPTEKQPEPRPGEQAPLLPPVMNFKKPKQTGNTYGGNFSGQASPTGLTRFEDQEALPLPRMEFPRK